MESKEREGGNNTYLHGQATAIHSNGFAGIDAMDSAKVFIHLPSNHNTFYNNEYGGQHAEGGATITNVED